MSRRRSMSASSERVAESSRSTTRWSCRSVSTTSIANIRSSSLGLCAAAAAAAASDIDAVILAVEDQLLDALAALLDRGLDLLRVLGGELAHLLDDAERLLLEIGDGVDELDDGVGADRRAVAGAQRRLLHLVTELGEHLDATRHPFLHRLERLRRLMQAGEPGERSL